MAVLVVVRIVAQQKTVCKTRSRSRRRRRRASRALTPRFSGHRIRHSRVLSVEKAALAGDVNSDMASVGGVDTSGRATYGRVTGKRCMLRRVDLEQREQETLAPYAVQSANSGGRMYPEDEHPFRLAFQRDRDRVVHSTAFRRLEYKTQVFVNHEGDLFRTRLTHTLEVAQIGRGIARGLHVNEDLVEAITLAHDLGHTPFGHAGQDALHECMAQHGGFEHNVQSLRVVDHLEQRYPAFDGLNLCFET